VVDLLRRPLHPVREPVDDVLGVVGIDLGHVIEPRVSLGGIAGLEQRRPVVIERGHAVAFDPAAGGDEELVRDEHRFARRPRHLFDRAV
jgi:hypothetical protein